MVPMTRQDVLEMAGRSTAALDGLLRSMPTDDEGIPTQTAGSVMAIAAVAQSWSALAACMKPDDVVNLPPECGGVVKALKEQMAVKEGED